MCFMTYGGWWTGAAFGVLDIGARALRQLLQQKRALEAKLLDTASQADQSQAGGFIVLLNLVCAALQL